MSSGPPETESVAVAFIPLPTAHYELRTPLLILHRQRVASVKFREMRGPRIDLAAFCEIQKPQAGAVVVVL